MHQEAGRKQTVRNQYVANNRMTGPEKKKKKK